MNQFPRVWLLERSLLQEDINSIEIRGRTYSNQLSFFLELTCDLVSYALINEHVVGSLISSQLKSNNKRYRIEPVFVRS